MGWGCWSHLAWMCLERPRLGECRDLWAPHPTPQPPHACPATCCGSQKPSRPRCLPGVAVCRGRVALASRRAAGPGWLESGGRSCGACTDHGQGRSVPGSPHQQAGQSEMETQHKAFRVPGGSRLYLQPYNPEQARCHLISEAKQVQAWLVFG